MDSKRGAISFIFIIAFVIFSISLISADHCYTANTRCEDNGDYTLMHLSALTNAHGEVYDMHAYDSNWYVCCTFSGGNVCDGTNAVLKLSTATNAHAQIPSMDSYNFDVCYGNLVCTSTTSTIEICPQDYPIFIVYLSNTASPGTNAHISGSTDLEPTGFLAGYDTRICCALNVPLCGNGVVDSSDGETCDDGNLDSGDGCDSSCHRESGCFCNSEATCCYCPPVTSLWQKNGEDFNSGGEIRVGDALEMMFNEDFCLDYRAEMTFNIIEGTTTRVATTGYSWGEGSSSAKYEILNTNFFEALGTGTSNIHFGITYPGTYNSLTIPVIPRWCGDGTCEAGYEDCNNCVADCDVCPPYCGDRNCNGYETCVDCESDCGICIPTCTLTSKEWSVSDAIGGQEVFLTVYGSPDCNDQPVTFEVFEYDPLSADDPVQYNPDSDTMNGGEATTSWIAEWPDTTGETGTLQYYFIPSTSGVSLAANNPRLSVTEPDPCGNGVVDSGETCSNCEIDVGPCCGNGVINSGEQCDSGVGTNNCKDALSNNAAIGNLVCWAPGTLNECQFDASDCSIPGVCTINSATWSATEVNAGTYVNLNILTSNCNNGEEITFVVKEADGLLNSDDPVINEPSPATINGNSATGSWRAEYQDDIDGGQENPPEYYFTATVTSNNEEMVSSDPKLIVNEVDVACIGINYCGDYTNEGDCTQDKCPVDYGFAPGFCGAFFNPETRCMDLTNCSCSWNINTNTCESGWKRNHLCGNCGNSVTDYGEQCDDGNNEDGDACSSTCQFEDDIAPPCPYGTTLCSDLTCSKNCYSTDTAIATCIIDDFCNVGTESCNCLDCQGVADTCAAGLICTIFNVACCNSESDGVCDPECSYVDPDCGPADCGNGYMEIGEQCDDGNNEDGDACSSTCELEILTPSCCPEGTAECESAPMTCSLNCYATDTSIVQDDSNCCSPLVFSVADQACCRTTTDDYCNPYCHYVDPDCMVIPPGDLDSGLCTYTDMTTDTCDDYILFRSLVGNWGWAVGNSYITNPTNEYWWDAECNAGAGCYRYDPFNRFGTLREHEECVLIQDNIACPDQIQIGMQILYSLIAAIVLIIIIYLIFFSRKKKKSHSNRKK